MKYLTLRNLRIIYSAFFLLLFIFFIAITDFRNMKGYEIALFLELSPLTALGTLLTSWTLYKGIFLSIIIIALTILFGRVFCSWLCPLGTLNQLTSRLLNPRTPKDDYKTNEYRAIHRIKYYILAVLLVLAAFGSLQIGLLDPIALLTRSFVIALFPALDYGSNLFFLKRPIFLGGVLIALIFLTLLFANRFLTRFWCRVLCPLGALLGLFSGFAIFKIRRDVEKCTDCKQCARNCHGGCEPEGELRQSECLGCMNCIEDCPEDAIHYGLAKTDTSVHKPIDLNRRRLLESIAAGALLFPMLRTSLGAATKSNHQVIRPPGSLPEGDFLRRCIKCGECMRVCPTNALQPALLEGGLEGLWTPILVNRIGYCEYNCVLCGQACPTGAIEPISIAKKLGRKTAKLSGDSSGDSDNNRPGAALEPIRLGTAFYDRGRCLPWAMHTECIVCEEVCPTSPKAIFYKKVTVTDVAGYKRELKQPYVEPKRCIGCGICENKCPVADMAAIRVTSVGETRSRDNRMLL